MEILEKRLDCALLAPSITKDVRGWFNVAFCLDDIRSLDINFKCVEQLNHSHTEVAGVIRGLNYQEKPYEQAKIVRCTRGSLYSVGVNIDRTSSSFGKYCGFELNSTGMNLMYLPRGYAHGFITLENHTELEYLTDNKYSYKHAKSIRFDDPDIGIDWTINGRIKINPYIMSEKNRHAAMLKEMILTDELFQ